MYESDFFRPGRAVRRSPGAVVAAAKLVPCHPAYIAALIATEAAGSGYWPDGRVKCLYEPHWLNRLLPKSKRAGALATGLSRRKWDRTHYRKHQRSPDDRYRLLDRVARAYGAEIAADASSWGAGQQLGVNAEKCGFTNASHMYAAYADSEDEQIMGIVRFCLRSGLRQALQRGDVKAITRVYNGPGQVAHYSGIMQGHIDRYMKEDWGWTPSGAPEAPKQRQWLGLGDKGDDVRALQRSLRDLGYHLQVDGDFGRATDRAVRAFQHDRGLKSDGLAGEDTLAELVRARKTPAVHQVGTETVPDSREAVTGDDLLKMGSSTVRRAKLGKLLDTVKAALGFGGAAGALSVGDAVEAGQEVQFKVEQTRGLLDWLIPSSFAHWVGLILFIVGVIALIDWLRNNAIEKNKVEEYRSGKVLTVGDGEGSEWNS
jgi:hypothetical protein